jgi:hypothetical protein
MEQNIDTVIDEDDKLWIDLLTSKFPNYKHLNIRSLLFMRDMVAFDLLENKKTPLVLVYDQYKMMVELKK